MYYRNFDHPINYVRRKADWITLGVVDVNIQWLLEPNCFWTAIKQLSSINGFPTHVALHTCRHGNPLRIIFYRRCRYIITHYSENIICILYVEYQITIQG